MQARTRIKICGIRDGDAAWAAIEAGADALGFVFHEGSPRYIDPEEAYGIVRALPPMVASVGLFVNASEERFIEISETCPTDYAQLHGQEDEELVRACGPRVIKAVRFESGSIGEELSRWSALDEVDGILVDGSSGGKGTAFDWGALGAVRERAGDRALFVAGGLTPENVGEAVRMARPYAVDVSSGVELAGRPGEKDFTRIRAFCDAVRAADGEIARQAC
ncbi:MAG: N-(5'-phosphoribosyl)anthranilate isomerase [Phycisphaerales bacterium]